MTKPHRSIYKSMHARVSNLVREADSIGLIESGAPQDEYDLEVSSILPHLRKVNSPEDVRKVIHEVFVEFFGKTAGAPERYTSLSEDVWKVWKSSRANEIV